VVGVVAMAAIRRLKWIAYRRQQRLAKERASEGRRGLLRTLSACVDGQKRPAPLCKPSVAVVRFQMRFARPNSVSTMPRLKCKAEQ
jgi:hypothetical protein